MKDGIQLTIQSAWLKEREGERERQENWLIYFISATIDDLFLVVWAFERK